MDPATGDIAPTALAPDQAAPASPRASFAISRDLFIRSLGVVYACAFASMWVQMRGLFGSRGVLPVTEYLQAARDQLGDQAFCRLPTLFWYDASDRTLVG